MPDVLVNGGSSLESLAAVLTKRFLGGDGHAPAPKPRPEPVATATPAASGDRQPKARKRLPALTIRDTKTAV